MTGFGLVARPFGAPRWGAPRERSAPALRGRFVWLRLVVVCCCRCSARLALSVVSLRSALVGRGCAAPVGASAPSFAVSLCSGRPRLARRVPRPFSARAARRAPLCWRRAALVPARAGAPRPSGRSGRSAAPLCAAPPLLFGLCGAPVFVAATAVRCLLPFRSWLLRLSLRAPRLRLRARCFASRSALLAFRCGRFFAPLGAVRAGGGVPAAPHGALAPLSSLGGVRAGGGVPAAPHAPRSFFAPRCSLLAPAVGVRSVARFAPLGAVRAGGGVPAAPHGALCFRGRLCAAPPLLGCLSVLRGGGRFFGAPAPSRPALCPASLHGAYSVFSVGRSASAVFSGLFPALPRGRPCFCRGSSRPVGRVPAPLVGVAVPPLRRGGASFLIRGFLCPARAAVRCRVLFLVFLPLRCGRFGRQLPPEHPSLAPFFALGGRCRAAVAARTPANRPAASSAGGAPGRPPPSPPPSPASPVGAAPYSLSPLICGRGRGSLRGPLGRRSLRSRPRPLSGRLSGWLRRLLCVLLLRARWLRAGGGIRSA